MTHHGPEYVLPVQVIDMCTIHLCQVGDFRKDVDWHWENQDTSPENLSRVLPKMSLSSNVKIKHVRVQRTMCSDSVQRTYMRYPTKSSHVHNQSPCVTLSGGARGSILH